MKLLPKHAFCHWSSCRFVLLIFLHIRTCWWLGEGKNYSYFQFISMTRMFSDVKTVRKYTRASAKLLAPLITCPIKETNTLITVRKLELTCCISLGKTHIHRDVLCSFSFFSCFLQYRVFCCLIPLRSYF